MPKTKISEFSATPANNTDIDSINIAEGCAPSGINDAIRELMAQLKDFQTGAVGDSFNGPVGSTTAGTGAFTTLSASGTATLSGLTASTALALDASKNIVSVTNTGTGSNVLATSPTLVTPALGTPSSGVVTNLTGTASININGTVGATTATTGAFTTLAASSTVTLSGGTANGVAYLNGSKVVTSGSALVFDGTDLAVGNAGGLALFKRASDGLSVGRVGSRSSTDISMYNAGGVTAEFVAGANELKFNVSASEQMRLTSTGLGIGTSSPAYKLDVNTVGGSIATARLYGNDQSNVRLRLENAGSGGRTWEIVGGSPGANNANFSIRDVTGSTTPLTIDSSGNLGLGVTPSAWSGYGAPIIQLPNTGTIVSNDQFAYFGANWYYATSALRYITSSETASYYGQAGGAHKWFSAPSGTAGDAITFTQAMTLDASGNLLVGTTSLTSNERVSIVTGATEGFRVKTTGGASASAGIIHNATTTGDNVFIDFGTEASYTSRGSITYNRAGGLVAYNVTSDYRAKDITGSVTNSGALIDSVPVYMGKMKDATQERPMFIAHETPAYAHTGVKDAVDADGNPVYQQMDASALIPVMWAEIQSLRKRLADAGI